MEHFDSSVAIGVVILISMIIVGAWVLYKLLFGIDWSLHSDWNRQWLSKSLSDMCKFFDVYDQTIVHDNQTYHTADMTLVSHDLRYARKYDWMFGTTRTTTLDVMLRDEQSQKMFRVRVIREVTSGPRTGPMEPTTARSWVTTKLIIPADIPHDITEPADLYQHETVYC